MHAVRREAIYGYTVIVSMIVPVYMHTWQGCCVMIQPIQLQWTNRLHAASAMYSMAASSSGSPPNVSHSLYSNIYYRCGRGLGTGLSGLMRILAL